MVAMKYFFETARSWAISIASGCGCDCANTKSRNSARVNERGLSKIVRVRYASRDKRSVSIACATFSWRSAYSSQSRPNFAAAARRDACPHPSLSSTPPRSKKIVVIMKVAQTSVCDSWPRLQSVILSSTHRLKSVLLTNDGRPDGPASLRQMSHDKSPLLYRARLTRSEEHTSELQSLAYLVC